MWIDRAEHLEHCDQDGAMDARFARLKFSLVILATAAAWLVGESMASPAHADLIRPSSRRTFPDIAGDLVGTQTYTYDPSTKTGTFALTTTPHLIKLGPEFDAMIRMAPDQQGKLSQSLRMTLDAKGRLVDSPQNRFEIRGTVVIGDKTYEGLLLSGRPRSFGAASGNSQRVTDHLFDLDLKITGGELKPAFGDEAYLRIRPREHSTFSGQFDTDFSSDSPVTSLRAVRDSLATPVPEPSPFVILLTVGAGALAIRLRRKLKPPRGSSRNLPDLPCPSTASWTHKSSRTC